jgi:hypothetical protein
MRSPPRRLLRKQSFIRPDGHGRDRPFGRAWGALALAGEDPKKLPPSSRSRRGAAGMPMIFRPGLRAAYADRRGRRVRQAARVKVTWLVAANDSYFSPAFSRQLVDAFRGAGGKADFHVLPAHGGEGTGWWKPRAG